MEVVFGDQVKGQVLDQMQSLVVSYTTCLPCTKSSFGPIPMRCRELAVYQYAYPQCRRSIDCLVVEILWISDKKVSEFESLTRNCLKFLQQLIF